MIYDLFPLLACQIRSCAPQAWPVREPLEYFSSYRLSEHRGYHTYARSSPAGLRPEPGRPTEETKKRLLNRQRRLTSLKRASRFRQVVHNNNVILEEVTIESAGERERSIDRRVNDQLGPLLSCPAPVPAREARVTIPRTRMR